jgi:hypothetical protein
MAAQQPKTPFRQIRAVFTEDTVTVYQAYSSAIADAAVAAQRLNASSSFKSGTRMTWIKPSWCWMLYRAGYSYKDAGQERILALVMKRESFLELLRKGVLTHGPGAVAKTASPEPKEGNPALTEKDETAEDTSELAASGSRGHRGDGRRARERGKRRDRIVQDKSGQTEVKIQWDPERDARLQRLDYRSIQIGIPPGLVREWVGDWIARIEDVTETARQLKKTLDENPGIEDSKLVEMGLLPVEREFPLPEDLRLSLKMGTGDQAADDGAPEVSD